MRRPGAALAACLLWLASCGQALAWAEGGQTPILAGGYLSSLFFGRDDHFVGPGVLDLLVLGLAIYLGYRFIRSRKPEEPDKKETRRPTPQDLRPPDPRAPDRSDDASQAPPPPSPRPVPRRPADRFEAAQHMWEMLGAGRPADEGRSRPTAPDGLDHGELVRGAKVVYVKVNEAVDKKTLQNVQDFLTPEGMRQLQAFSRSRPGEDPRDILMVDADVLDMDEAEGATRVRISFRSLMRDNGGQQESHEVQETWRFLRRDPNDHWRLEAVENGPAAEAGAAEDSAR